MLAILSLIGIVLGLVLLVYLAYRGHSIIWVAPVCALIVALMSGANLLDSYLVDYIGGTAAYIVSWFPAFFLGAVYGKIMDRRALRAPLQTEWLHLSAQDMRFLRLFCPVC